MSLKIYVRGQLDPQDFQKVEKEISDMMTGKTQIPTIETGMRDQKEQRNSKDA